MLSSSGGLPYTYDLLQVAYPTLVNVQGNVQRATSIYVVVTVKHLPVPTQGAL